MDSAQLEVLEKQPLAFSSGGNNLVSATSRLPFVTADGSAVLNVECFFFEDKENEPPLNLSPAPIILYVHGVCSSAETLGVQNIVSQAKKKNYRVTVLELEGHGFSSGARAVCGDFMRLVQHVTEYVKHVLTTLSKQEKSRTIPFILCGNSLGGVLMSYAADIISRSLAEYPGRFMGVALIAPAVGVDKSAVPHPVAIGALKIFSYLAPSATVSLTPMEDPISYASPKNSTRNYHGHWPLATSRMLFDVTNETVKRDIQNGTLSMNKVNSLIIFAGEKDDIVPYEAVQEFHESIGAREKALINVPDAGHDLLYQAPFANEIVNQIFQWMELRMWAVGRLNGTSP